MQFYRTTDVVNIPIGFKLMLSETQIQDRKPNLIVKVKGKCEVRNPIQFKRGEMIGIEDPNKVMLKGLELVEEKKGDTKN